MSRPDDDPQFFDYGVGEPEHLIDGFEPGDFWSPPTGNPAPIDFGYSPEQQSIAVFSPATTFSGPSPFVDSRSPLFESLSSPTDVLYSSGSSPVISATSSLGLYGRVSPDNSPSLHTGSYVSPAALQGFEFYPTDNFGLGTPESGVVASPALADCNLSDSTSGVYGDETMYRSEEASKGESSSGMTRSKRVKMASGQNVEAVWTPPSGSGQTTDSSGSDKGKSKLRSASRTSKNINHKPDETVEERKTRNAHNVIEKQYRNRLNARFEGLLGVLPSSLRSAGNGDGNEVRLCKGDVLDMSTTYIRTLESQRSQLEREHEELNSRIDRLHGMLANERRPNPDGFGGDGS